LIFFHPGLIITDHMLNASSLNGLVFSLLLLGSLFLSTKRPYLGTIFMVLACSMSSAIWQYIAVGVLGSLLTLGCANVRAGTWSVAGLFRMLSLVMTTSALIWYPLRAHTEKIVSNLFSSLFDTCYVSGAQLLGTCVLP
jgi:hypothetical protein